MLHLELKKIIDLLKEFTIQSGNAIEIILFGGLSLHYYGLKERRTIDVDGEVKGDVEGLFNFLKSKKIPSDIGEDISHWSVISMPPGYRERAIEIYTDDLLTVKVLHPLDFIIAKLRRSTDEDIEDALFVAKRYNIRAKDIKEAADMAIENSPKDTAIFIFRKNIELFIKKINTL